MKSILNRWFVFLQICFLILDTFLVLKKVSIDAENVWNYGWIILSLQMVYAVLSFKTVGAEEKAAVLFFGRPMSEVQSGLVFVPWLICTLRKESRLTIQIQIPGEPEEIDKSGVDETGVAKGKVLPIRATTTSFDIVKDNPDFSGDPALNQNDPLSVRMTLEVTAQIRFKIKDIVKFIRNIGSTKEAKKQLRDTAEAVIKSEFAKRTPALIIAHWSEISDILKKKIGILVRDDLNTPEDDEGWGVLIETAQLIDVDINKKVNEALSLVTAAKITAVKVEIDAKAAKLKKTEEGLGEKAFETSKGEGLASARQAMLVANSVGYKKLEELAKTPEGRAVLATEQARLMYTEANYSVLPSDGSGLFGAIAGIQEVLKGIQESKDAKKKGDE